MRWKKTKWGGSGYISPTIERAVRHALVYGELYESLELRFASNERLLRESWAFWSDHLPTDLDDASLQEWIYAPFAPPEPKPNDE